MDNVKKIKEPVLTGHDAYVNRLQAGQTISFRSGGNSMRPRSKSGQKCTYSPVQGIDDVKNGDAVFCKVGHSKFTHLITAMRGEQVQISNNSGHVNGWTHISNVYGKVIKVED